MVCWEHTSLIFIVGTFRLIFGLFGVLFGISRVENRLIDLSVTCLTPGK